MNPDLYQEKIETLLKQMTLTEKVSLLSGRNKWYTVPVERFPIMTHTCRVGWQNQVSSRCW